MIDALRITWATLHSRAGALYLVTVIGYLTLFSLLRFRIALFSVVVFPGTVFHELSHWAAGILFRGRPRRLRLWPKRNGTRMVMGSVECTNLRWYNGVFIGLAPLALLPIALTLMIWSIGLAPGLRVGDAGWAYLVACFTYASIPSGQDLRIASVSRWMLISIAILAGSAWFWLRVR
ncbi:MAG: hypothetical protein ACYDHM_13220 [Acidiferrobacterales bacterium]